MLDRQWVTIISAVCQVSYFLEERDSILRKMLLCAYLSPDMWDRTITISSAGKTFSVTGWQVGWLIGPERYVAPVQAMLPCVQFCAPTPIQEALARAIVIADQPYEGYAR